MRGRETSASQRHTNGNRAKNQGGKEQGEGSYRLLRRTTGKVPGITLYSHLVEGWVKLRHLQIVGAYLPHLWVTRRQNQLGKLVVLFNYISFKRRLVVVMYSRV